VSAVHRIPDLREPRRDAREQALYDFACSLEVDLSVEAVVDAAVRSTGLDALDDPTVLDRLRSQIDAVNLDAGLSGLGRLIVRRRLEGLLGARLRFDDFVRRYPEALAIELAPPVIVVGLPRSGTTHLVNLLAADARFRSLPWWECAEPVPVRGVGPGRDGVDPRYLRSLADWEAGKQAAPLTQYMHDRPPWSIEEDCELVDLDFCSYTLEWHARVPQWRDAYLALDQRAHYAFLRRELQVLSFLRGPRRWVLKTPQHLEQLPALIATFPDATIALTLRDPVAVLQSAVTMLAYGDRLRRVEIDADGLARYWVDRIERLLRAAVRDLGAVPADRRVDVEFGAFMADDLGTACRILEQARIAVTDNARAALASYVAGNPRGRAGSVAYDLRGDFGLEPDAVRERFRFYFDAFPQIRAEVH
jgi:hypothetical protein